nr:putative membrane protein [Mycobacterium pseudoshottsii]
MTIKRPVRQSLSCAIRRLSIPIVIGWIALSAYLTVGSPPLEVVGQLHSVSMNPRDAPSAVAMRRIRELFKESDSDNTAMILLEGDQPLGDNAHY